MKARSQVLAAAMFAVMMAGGSASAATITFVGAVADQGTGFGAVAPLLSLQNNGSESGSVQWTILGDNETGDATNQSSTQTAATVAAAGGTAADGFFFILQVNQTGLNSPIDLNSLSLTFYGPLGNTLFTATFVDNPGNTDPWDALTGVGVGSSGYLFHVDFAGTQGTTFFGNAGNRVGQSASFANSDDGPDSFFLAEASDEPVPPSEVPEPTSLLLLGSGLVGLGVWRRKRARA